MQLVNCNIDPIEGIKPSVVRKQAAKALGRKTSEIGPTVLVQQSLDVRGQYPVVHCVVQVYEIGEEVPQERAEYRDVRNASQVIVVGAGPAGLFAALTLLERGIKPVILERGKDIHARKVDIALVNKGLGVNPESNFCFGEGGAGTFSDGKLYTRATKRGDVGKVLRTFVAHGAPEQILSQVHAHLGSDRLPAIIENIRKTLLEHGGEYHFETRVNGLLVRDGQVYGVTDTAGNRWEGRAVVLATGHSAVDIYRMFEREGWPIEAKGFALGVRVEHPQEVINRIQYARVAPRYRNILPPAAYQAVAQVEGKGVFSFCMCPGGQVVPSSTQAEGLALNGMSNSKRSGFWANAGVVVSVNPEDLMTEKLYFDGNPDSPLALLEWQLQMERAARVGGASAPVMAPAQRMTDFAKGHISSSLPETSYRPGCLEAPLHALLPPAVSGRLLRGFREFDKKMRGYFTDQALLLGIESRTSSPVRLPRDKETLQHVLLKGLYPCGEGAGYAGGIVSSALDGIQAASKISAK